MVSMWGEKEFVVLGGATTMDLTDKDYQRGGGLIFSVEQGYVVSKQLNLDDRKNKFCAPGNVAIPYKKGTVAAFVQ